MSNTTNRPPLLFEDLTGQIRQTAYEVHTYFGPGFLEKVYQNSLRNRLRRLGFEIDDNYQIEVKDEDGTVVGDYSPDLMVNSKIVVELKAARSLSSADTAQILNYLKATRMRLGLLINFGASKLEFRRFVWS